MKYRNSEIKIDALVGYLRENKINLNPAFQRGHVWKINQRQGLVRNILAGKPIPAIFLYKEAVGSRYSYNILDGKQRLESIILFIGSARQDFNLADWSDFFFSPAIRRQAGFEVEVAEEKFSIANLDDDYLRDFREYIIPTVEIELDENTSLDEIISLFIDINQQGEPVKRFDIVKALYKNKGFLRQVFKLIAIEQQRKNDIFYKMIQNEITACLKHLQIITAVQDANAKIDRMWERLIEIALFVIRKDHTKPLTILKDFIKQDTDLPTTLNASTVKTIRSLFRRMRACFSATREDLIFRTDYVHFYILATILISQPDIADLPDFPQRLQVASDLIRPTRRVRISGRIREYIDFSSKQTTDPSRRRTRADLLVKILTTLQV